MFQTICCVSALAFLSARTLTSRKLHKLRNILNVFGYFEQMCERVTVHCFQYTSVPMFSKDKYHRVSAIYLSKSHEAP